MMKIHHIGYAVKDIDRAIKTLKMLGFCSGEIVQDPLRNVQISFLHHGAQCIELIAPYANPNPVENILKKSGPTPYHICYEVPNLDQAIEHATSNGFILVKKPEAACAIDERLVAFLWNKDIGLIELLG